MHILWTILAVIVAGVAGTIANSVVVATMTSNTFAELATKPGRIGVAIAVAVLLPLIYAQDSGFAAAVIAIAAMAIIPSSLSKLIFRQGAPWGSVLAVNTVYAVVAWAVFLGIMQIPPTA